LLGKFKGMASEIIKNQVKNSVRVGKGRHYIVEIKQLFALALHYYSPKAYAYCW
jgi:hypothetical protein